MYVMCLVKVVFLLFIKIKILHNYKPLPENPVQASGKSQYKATKYCLLW